MHNDLKQHSNLWRLNELASGLSSNAQEEFLKQDQPVKRVVVDSRLAMDGDLFIALPGNPGPRFNTSRVSDLDGHDFVEDAHSKGALAAIVSRAVPALLPQIIVDDTYDALWNLGTMARARLQHPVCAITGSSGKTTAKHFLTASLGAYSPPGSFNNHIGVPLALANATPNYAASVFEIGTSGPGEIQPLAAMVRPNLAILLNVQSAHIENFAGDRGALFKEKVKIFSAMEDNGIKISESSLNLPGYTFGDAVDANAQIQAIYGDKLVLKMFNEEVRAKIPGGGVHRALTLMACILATKLLDMDLTPILNLEHSVIPQGRGNEISVAGVTIIDDSYNANPASMGAAIQAFSQREGERKIAVLGEMRELGAASLQAHKDLLSQIENFDQVFLVGDEMLRMAAALDMKTAPAENQKTKPGLHFYPTANEDLLADLLRAIRVKDTILIKGSNRVFWSSDFVSVLTKAVSEK